MKEGEVSPSLQPALRSSATLSAGGGPPQRPPLSFYGLTGESLKDCPIKSGNDTPNIALTPLAVTDTNIDVLIEA